VYDDEMVEIEDQDNSFPCRFSSYSSFYQWISQLVFSDFYSAGVGSRTAKW